ncbi:MAG TPA: GntR family transcriptional regulator [Limnochordales bacterium]
MSESAGPALAPVTAETVVSVSEAVTRALREAILHGRLRPGQRLVQEELAAQLGTSRQPVREALRRLESEGLIVPLPQRGFVVREFREEDLRENYHLRQLLESEAARLAAGRMPAEALEQLREVHRSMARAVRRQDQGSVVELNARFHRLVHQASGMSQLVRLIQQLWAGRTVFTPVFVPGRAQRSVQEHQAILDALAARDGERAAQAMREHIARAAADYLQRLFHMRQAEVNGAGTDT